MEFSRTTSIWQLSLLLFGLSLIVPSSADDAIETNKVPYKIYLDADQPIVRVQVSQLSLVFALL